MFQQLFIRKGKQISLAHYFAIGKKGVGIVNKMNTTYSDNVNRQFVRVIIEHKLSIINQLFNSNNFNFNAHLDILHHITKIRNLMYKWTPKEAREGSMAVIVRETTIKRLKDIFDTAKSYSQTDEINVYYYKMNIIDELTGIYKLICGPP